MHVSLTIALLLAAQGEGLEGFTLEKRLIHTIPEDLGYVYDHEIHVAPGGKAVAVRKSRLNEGSRMPVFSYKGFSIESMGNQYGVTWQGDTIIHGYSPEMFKNCVVVGEKQHPWYSQVSRVVVSDDQSTNAYIASDGKRSFLVKNGVVQTTVTGIDLYSHLAFKPGTRNLAFFTYDEKIGSYLQVGKDKTKISWNTRGGVRFSPDGSKLAYAAWDKNAQFVVVNGKKGLTYEYVGIPSFSRDSSTVAYVAVKRGREFLVYGRKRGKSYPTRLAKGFRPLAIMGTQPKGIRITEFDLSADGQKAAFAVREPDTGKAAVITNGKRSKEGFGQIWKIAMSPSGESGAFIALTGKADKTRMHVVVNDEEFGPYHWVPTLLANPVSDEFAFTVEDPGPKYLLRVGDQETSAFGKVYSPEYGADGRTFSFGMRKGPEMYWVTLTRGE